LYVDKISYLAPQKKQLEKPFQIFE
jgi:hypothetical protein